MSTSLSPRAISRRRLLQLGGVGALAMGVPGTVAARMDAAERLNARSGLPGSLNDTRTSESESAQQSWRDVQRRGFEIRTSESPVRVTAGPKEGRRPALP